MANPHENDLIENRRKLNEVLNSNFTEQVSRNWGQVKPLIDNWWRVYKQWESEDTWDAAFKEDRMSVRTFAGNFDAQRSKTVPDPGVRFNLGSDRFFRDSAYTPLQGGDREVAESLFEEQMAPTFKAEKGIDSSAFANPRNFATREAKYQAGLHDLSASLLKYGDGLSIFSQVHHKEAPAFFSFLPLSMEEDQVVLYYLFRHSKAQLGQPLYNMVRGYRAAMTRVKVAQDFDMATGYTAIPIKLGASPPKVTALTGMKARAAMWEPRPPAGPTYKVRFGLASKTTPTGHAEADVTVTEEFYRARQANALSFKQILRTEHAIRAQKKLQDDGEGFKNEMVIALREHKSGFPIYAFRPLVERGEPDVLRCFKIVGGTMRDNNIRISAAGAMNPPDKGTTPPRRW
ncbi:MAG TPA: hypothetical protein VL523_07885 [Terriglobia bacterium]|nr:hypothetical protein [Terriglobia bacterium]